EREGGEQAAYLDRGTYQLLITTLIQDYGEAGKAVIVGRASQLILSGRGNAVHVKIIAPLEVRCERLMQSRNVSFDQAKELVEQHDRWRKLYLRNYHDADWDDLLLYHLTINTGRMSAGEATDLIVNLLTGRA
ncbi:MAG: cytidylate kinase-like family protein, partial [Gemmatimonadetes bacterium]|nr:cytidylate kinase-like family protein [Gemmatimonadota bacterium]